MTAGKVHTLWRLTRLQRTVHISWWHSKPQTHTGELFRRAASAGLAALIVNLTFVQCGKTHKNLKRVKADGEKREWKGVLTSAVYFNELTLTGEAERQRGGGRGKCGEERKTREWTEGGSTVIRWGEVFSAVAGQRIRIELGVCVCAFVSFCWSSSEALSLAFPPQAGAAKPVTMETQLKCVCACVSALSCACEPLKRDSLCVPVN